jgi:outer membrane protein assembly factor BamB
VLYVSDTAAVNAIKLGDTPEWLWKTPLGDGTTTVVSGTVSVDGDYVVASSLSPAVDAEGEKRGTTIHVLKVGDGAEDFRFQFRAEGETHQLAVQDGMLYSRVDNTFMERSYFFSTTIDGEERWLSRASLGAAPAYPAVDGDLVYIPGGDRVWAYDAATGETVWSSPPVQSLDTELALIDGVVYIGAAPPTPMLYAVSAADGTLLSSISVPYNGARVIGITNGVLIARSGIHLVALANLP